VSLENTTNSKRDCLGHEDEERCLKV
jgi:hypothetical protein